MKNKDFLKIILICIIMILCLFGVYIGNIKRISDKEKTLIVNYPIVTTAPTAIISKPTPTITPTPTLEPTLISTSEELTTFNNLEDIEIETTEEIEDEMSYQQKKQQISNQKK